MIPKINDVPKYEIQIPSTGKNVKYRPYLVKEEKVLLTAYESEDRRHIWKSIVEAIEACVQGDMNVDELTMYDVQYLFTKIRSKSAGEEVNLNITCTGCGEKTPVNLNIDNVTMESKPSSDIIKLNDEISVEVEYPKYTAMIKNNVIMSKAEEHERLLNTILESIKTIITPDIRIVAKEESREELLEFVESLDQKQFYDIFNFVDNAPKIIYKADYKCVHCSMENKIEVKDDEDFF